jgi:hypothetical protein
MPTKSQIQSWNTDALEAAAKAWGQRATTLKDAYNKAQHELDNTGWSGTASDQARARLKADATKVQTAIEQIEHAEKTASNGAQSIADAKRDAVNAIDRAEHELFRVSEDLAVTDPLRVIELGPIRIIRDLARHMHEALIRARAMALASTDAQVAAALKLIATTLGRFKLGGGPGSSSDPGNPLPPNGVKNLGPIAGTGAQPGIPGIGAADLGEIVELPDGRLVAVFGDSFKGDKVGGPDNEHYRSVAVPIVGWDKDGKPIFGQPFNSPGGPGTPNVLFPPPPEALAIDPNTNPLPAGSFQVNGKTYMMVSGTSGLKPTAGSWLVEVSNDPSKGWQPVPGSWRPSRPGVPGNPPTQISGYQGKDGMVYIAADSFDRSQGVTMYRVDPTNATDRNAWQPWTGKDWGQPGQAPTLVTQQGAHYGELSFRDVDGHPVLSGFNSTPGVNQVEVRVADDPTRMFAPGVTPIVAAQQTAPAAPGYIYQPYGGYIMPGSTLDDLNILVSQWNTQNGPDGTPLGAPYDTQQVHVNASK